MQDRQTFTSPSTRPDEIDLRELFRSMSRFFMRIGRSIINSILALRRATRRYAWLLSAFALVGAGIGYGVYASFKPYYGSQMMVSSKYYNLEMITGFIEELNLLADEDNDAVLSKKLSISRDAAAQIRSLSVVPTSTTQQIIQMEQILNSIGDNKDISPAQMLILRDQLTLGFSDYLIVATVYDLDILDALEAGLQQYLLQNDYVQRRVAIEQQNLNSLQEKLQQELAKLSQLKTLQSEVLGRLVETNRAGSNNVIFGTPEASNDPLNVYREDITLYQRLLDTNKEIELNRGLEVISGFTPYGNPASISLKGNLLLGAALGIATAYLIILLIGLNQLLNRIEDRQTAQKAYA